MAWLLFCAVHVGPWPWAYSALRSGVRTNPGLGMQGGDNCSERGLSKSDLKPNQTVAF